MLSTQHFTTYRRDFLRFGTLSLATLAFGAVSNRASASEIHSAKNTINTGFKETKLTLSKEWDKTFARSTKVNHQKITFHNRYGITLAADIYTPKTTSNKNAKFPALAISGPFGAVKEQSSGLYAQTLAQMGFITLAFDPSYTGESGGMPRFVTSPDINVEDFSAAIDFLSIQKNVDNQRIGVVGICGFGGFAISAAANDPRIKATLASTMYDMSRVNANGYFDKEDSKEARLKKRRDLSTQRIKDYQNNSYALAGGVPNTLPQDAPQFLKDYYDYYKTQRGYHKRSLNSNSGWNITSNLPFLNLPILTYADEIDSAVLLIHGEKAHSRYFSEDTFKKLQGKNKELHIIKNASHTDLYDKTDIIPFEKIAMFFTQNL
ncbi:alpha/beta hydrolase [Helicobacter aurati]|uniref:Alpha/beta hydrolase n=1 Tax=Helicobacter aurati TaxID=137778 RepID=A0A3D8J2S0_9HELI|nr:alpha/beta hydrolase [Helicobacter aurati]RDU71061.1 alpha/beta hydrolase [Helicobacter aurati]